MGIYVFAGSFAGGTSRGDGSMHYRNVVVVGLFVVLIVGMELLKSVSCNLLSDLSRGDAWHPA